MASVNEEHVELEKEIERNKAEIIELLNAKSLIKTKIQRCDTLLEQINIRKSQLNQKLIEFQSQKDSQDAMIAELEEQLKGIEEEIKQVTEQLSDYRQHLAELRTKNSEITAALAKNQEKYHKTKSNLEALKNITERYEGYGNSIKKVMELKDTKKGIIGVVADIIKVDKKYEVAIETALGGNIQNIVTDTETTAKDTIEYLKKHRFGRATFLPLSSMSNKTNFNAPDALEEKGVIGLASDLVDIKKEYEGVAKYLLGRVMVVDTNVGGSISGGAFKNNSNLLGRRREIDELEKYISKLREEKSALDKELLDNRSNTSAVNEEINKINAGLQEQQIIKNTVEINLKQAKTQKDNIITQYQGFTLESNNIASEIQDINKNNNKLSDELSDTEDRNSELEKQVVEKTKKLTELKEVLNSKNGILEEVNIEIANLKQKHEFIVERINKSTEIIESLNRELQQIKVNSNENNEEISARVDAIDRFVKEVEKSIFVFSFFFLSVHDITIKNRHGKLRRADRTLKD